jgi:hypothetical protein
MTIKLSHWRVSVAAWRNNFSSRLVPRLNKLFVPFILGAIPACIAYLLREFFEPFSGWSIFAFFCTIIIVGTVVARFYRAAALASLAFVTFITVISLNASYQIASDQYRLRYRTVDGVSYLEFPKQFALIKYLAGNRLIMVAKCDATNVAVLPLLPFQPLFRENNIIDKTGFRRLPDFQFEGMRLNIEVSIDGVSASSGKLHGSFGFALGFSSTSHATIPITWIFPRSINCQQDHVPLLPILEVLPWNPNDVSSLVQAIIRVDQIRHDYPKNSISLDRLRQIQMTNDGTYSALLDVFEYSLIYQMFDGNIFAEMRAHVADTLCRVLDGHPSAFSGPFAALSDNFIRRLVAQLKSKVRLAAPACNVSDDLVRAYEKSTPADEPLFPFEATFKKCLQATTSMAQCLAKDDAPKAEPTCETLGCGIPAAPPAIPGEMLLEDYDGAFFYGVVATKKNKIVEISSMRPSECPVLRDKEENKHFVDWWIDHANEIVGESAECSSPAWQAKYAQSRGELFEALSCAKKRNIDGERYELEDPTLTDAIYTMKCNGSFNYNRDAMTKQMVAFLDQIDSINSRLRGFSDIIGSSETQSLIEAFQLFARLKQSICGTRDSKSCLDDFVLWQDNQRLMGNIINTFGLSNLGDGQGAFIDALSKLNNRIVDMAICDALQDDGFSKRTGYDRKVFCDTHDLAKYRMLGSEPVGHSLRRGNDERDPGVGYGYESNGINNKSFWMLKFLDR